MTLTCKLALPIAAAVLACAGLTARADAPPDWAVGRFVGGNGYIKADAEVIVTDRGRATLIYYPEWSQEPGRNRDRDRVVRRTTREEGTYRRGRLVFGSDSYEISKTGSGIKLVNTRERKDWMGLDRARSDYRRPEYRRDGPPAGWRSSEDDRRWRDDRDRRDRDERGRRVPDWAVGTFVGGNGYEKVDAEITIRADGSAVRVYRERTDRGRIERIAGRYEDGRVTFGRTTYEITRTGKGIKASNTREKRDWMGLDRSDRGLEERYRR